MASEQSKAAKRRFNDGAFLNRYFVGNGLDIGGRPDPLGQYSGVFPLMRSVKVWDKEQGDARTMPGVADDCFDFVHSSHCLEHMHDVSEALHHWIRITKPGGYLIITVPDEDLYEQGVFPSRYNEDHKWTMTIFKQKSWSSRSINLIDLCRSFADVVQVERLQLIRDFFRESLARQQIDQTRTPVAECAIEMILRKLPRE